MKLEHAILNTLHIQPGVRLAILFGSLAKGSATGNSDLDLAIDAGHKLTASEKIALITALAAATGRPVDLVDLHCAGEPLLGQILKYGQRLLGNDSDYGNLLRKHLFDQADYLPVRNRILADRRQAWIGK